jgi:hypothetical protein
MCIKWGNKHAPNEATHGSPEVGYVAKAPRKRFSLLQRSKLRRGRSTRAHRAAARDCQILPPLTTGLFDTHARSDISDHSLAVGDCWQKSDRLRLLSNKHRVLRA